MIFLIDLISFSILRPATEGNTSVKPTIDACDLCAAENASLTKTSANGESVWTS